MTELLERISKKMPEGWRLRYSMLSDWVLEESAPGCGSKQLTCLRPEGLVLDDIGLAPLTALLKQEIEKTRSIRMAWTLAGGCDLELWQNLIESEYHVGWVRGEITDFEVVAAAYLSIKEANNG